TCYFVLGLIAKTQQGVELLGEIGWESVVSSNGEPEGLCVPLNLHRFLMIRNWKYKAALSSSPQLPKSATDDPVGADILKNIGDMSNHILANEASKNLARLRQQYPDACSYHFRSPVRKYVLEIFDMRFTAELLEELDQLTASMKTCNDACTVFMSDLKKTNQPKSLSTTQVPEERLEAQHVKTGFNINNNRIIN
ncbi:hypothetical protein K501DRAFT_281212, partial [Backusella circina FSU 941]